MGGDAGQCMRGVPLVYSLYGVFPVPLGQFTSVTYLRRTGGKRRDKNRMRMRTLLFEIQDVVDSVVNGRKLWFFKNPCGYCAIDFCRPAMKSHQNAVHSPDGIDSAPLISSCQLSCRSLPLLAYLNDREFSK